MSDRTGLCPQFCQTSDPHTSTPAFSDTSSPISRICFSDSLSMACEGKHFTEQELILLHDCKPGTSQCFVEPPRNQGIEGLTPGSRVSPFLSLHTVLQELQWGLPDAGDSVCGQPGPPEPEAVSLPVPGRCSSPTEHEL